MNKFTFAFASAAIDAWECDFQVAIAQEAVISTDEEQGKAMYHFLNAEFGIKALKHEEILNKLS